MSASSSAGFTHKPLGSYCIRQIQSAKIQRKRYRFLPDSKSYRHKRQRRTDEAAKEVLSLNEASKTIVDLGNKINNLLQEDWQREWESEPNLNNKLKRVLPKLNENHTPKV